MKKRLERLEQEYFPQSERRTDSERVRYVTLSELNLLCTLEKKCQGLEDSALKVFRRAYDLVVNRARPHNQMEKT